jgi:translation initiation factor 2B subunit (eIF-2B alpha/beta/delta family)
VDAVRAGFKASRARLIKEARETLANSITSKDCILLFSVSSTVAECLGTVSQALRIKPRILIAECRNKSVRPFSDAAVYAKMVNEHGLDIERVHLISDASIGYYMSERSSEYCVTRIFLGMGEGWVDLRPGRFWVLNTVGSRAITALAKEFGQQVVVLGEVSKFSCEPPVPGRSAMKTDFGMDPLDPEIAALAQRLGTQSLDGITLDPVQDSIPSEEISALVTDAGSYLPSDFANFTAEIRATGKKGHRPAITTGRKRTRT